MNTACRLCVCLAFLFSSCGSQRPLKFSDELFAVPAGEKWGYIDQQGRQVITPRFDLAGPFSEGLAPVLVADSRSYRAFDSESSVESGGTWRYIDRTGNYRMKSSFWEAHPFHEGLARVSTRLTLGYADLTGIHLYAMGVDDNSIPEVAVIIAGPAEWCYIDATGEYVIGPQFKLGGDIVMPSMLGRTIKPKIEEARDFSSGLAAVRIGGKWGYMDRTGKPVVPPQFDSVSDFTEDMAAVAVGGKWGYVDRAGRRVITPRFEEAAPFYEGLAAVSVLGLRGYYIDRNGRLVIEPRFSEATAFCDGMAAVRMGTRWGYINRSGSMVIPAKFESADSFSEGLAAVKSEGKWSYIDKGGTPVLRPDRPNGLFSFFSSLECERAGRFHEGLADLTFRDKEGLTCGLINANGNFVWHSRIKTEMAQHFGRPQK